MWKYRGNHCIVSCSFVVWQLIQLYALYICMLKLAIFAAYCVFTIALKQSIQLALPLAFQSHHLLCIPNCYQDPLVKHHLCFDLLLWIFSTSLTQLFELHHTHYQGNLFQYKIPWSSFRIKISCTLDIPKARL